MKRKCLIAVVLFAVTGVPVLAKGGTEYSFANIQNMSATYTVDQENDISASVTVNHRMPNSSGSTSFFVTFSAGQSGSFTDRWLQDPTGAHLSYQIMDSATTRNILKDLTANPQPQEVLSGTNPASGITRVTSTFDVVLPAGQLPVAGTYTDSVVLQLYSGTPTGTYTLFDTQTMSISVVMPSVTDLSLVPTGSTFLPTSTAALMDFGVMSTGVSRSTDLLIRSNASYQVTLQSQNGGVMAITTAGDTSTVPYTFTFGGTPVSLPAATPVTVVASASPTTGGGTRYPIAVTIGDFGMASQGTYQDSITISVIAN